MQMVVNNPKSKKLKTKIILVDMNVWRLLKIESTKKETSILKLASKILIRSLGNEKEN